MVKYRPLIRFALKQPLSVFALGTSFYTSGVTGTKHAYYRMAREMREQANQDRADSEVRDESEPTPMAKQWHIKYLPEVLAFRALADSRGETCSMSVLIPVYMPDLGYLEQAVNSVLVQSEINYEIVLVADGLASANRVLESEVCRRLISTIERTADVRAHERQQQFRPQAVRLVVRTKQSGIWRTTLDGIQQVRGAFTVLLDQDDELHPEALRVFSNQSSHWDAMYSDHCTVDANGHVVGTFCKPDWSPILARTVMYPGHAKCFRSELLADAYERFPFDGTADHLSLLYLADGGYRVGHIPLVLAAWRQHEGSVAGNFWQKPVVAGEFAVGVNKLFADDTAYVTAKHESHVLSICYRRKQLQEEVSVIIPTAWKDGLAIRLLEALAGSVDVSLQVVVVDSAPEATPEEYFDFEEEARDKGGFVLNRVALQGRFNYSRAQNNGIAASMFENLLLLNDDLLPVSRDWIRHLVDFRRWSGAGIVGAKLWYPSGLVQHGGVRLGGREAAGHLYRNWTNYDGRAAESLSWNREVSAVTGACLLTTKGVVSSTGGFDEQYTIHYQDVDFCVRARNLGHAVVQCQDIGLIHIESASRGSAYSIEDRGLLVDRFKTDLILRDPFDLSYFGSSSFE